MDVHPKSTDGADTIEILVLGPRIDDDLEDVAKALSRELGCDVVIRHSDFDPACLVESGRGQIHAGRLLERLGEEDGLALRRLGLIAGDLYRPGVTFEFGEAMLGGDRAVLSLHRLREESYGLPSRPDVLRQRVFTEALHEIGHTFGLIHCDRPECAMAFSFDVQDLDAKGPTPCPECRAELRRRVRSEIRRRRPAPPRVRRSRTAMLVTVVALLLAMPLLPWDAGSAIAAPIRFPHGQHLHDSDLDCVDCHVDRTCGEWSGVPDRRACAPCHAGSHPEDPALSRVETWVREGGPAPWNSTHPRDGTDLRFHDREVRHGGAACRCCHGTKARESTGSCSLVDECAACHAPHEIRTTCATCHP